MRKAKKGIKRTSRFYVYIVECRDNTYYTGYTNDLAKRIERHNKGLASKYTRARLPVKMVWKKNCKDQSAAMRTEKRIKGLTRQDKQSLIHGSRLDNIMRKYKKI
ncbi:MAG: GIY-YIG nuclease family protein [Candidatus Omnitrophica bacterium]|nr:GIY-YIG nuclease family protein [Candidatus Omnitrophota bacterium]